MSDTPPGAYPVPGDQSAPTPAPVPPGYGAADQPGYAAPAGHPYGAPPPPVPAQPYGAPQPPPPGYGPPPPVAPGYGSAPPAPPPFGPPPPGYGPPPPEYGAAPMYQGGYVGGPPAPNNGLAVAALIVAILGLLACWIPYLGVPAPIVGLVLGFLALRKARVVHTGSGMAVAGVIISAIALLIALFVAVIVTVFIQDHRHLFDCGSSSLTPAQQQQCFRQQFGLPGSAPN